MPCNTPLTSIAKGCDNNTGGIKAIYIAPTEYVSGATLVNGTITGITMSGASKFTSIYFNKNSANYIEDGPNNLEAGSFVNSITLTLTIPRREVAKRNAISLIASGQRDVKLILLDFNGLYWYMGYENSANLTLIGEGSGSAKADGSKYSLTFLAEETQLMPEVSSGIISGIVS